MKRDLRIRDILSFIWVYWCRQGLWLGLLFAGTSVAIGFEILFPYVSSHMVNVISSSSTPPSDAEISAGIWAVTFFVAQSVGFYVVVRLYFRLWMHFAGRVMTDIVTETFARVQRFPSNWHESAHAGATVRKLTRGMWAYDTVADTIYAALIPAGLLVLAMLAVLSWHWPLVGLFGFVTCLIYLGTTIVMQVKYVTPRNKQHMAADSDVSAQVADAITCNAVVKSFGTEAREDGRLLGVVDTWRGKAIRSWSAMENVFIVQNASSVLLQAGVLGLVLAVWIEGNANAGDIVFAMTAYLLIHGYLRDMGYHLQNLQLGMSELEDLIAFHHMPVEAAVAEAGPPLEVKGGAIRFDNVRFRYPRKDEAVYASLSLDIAAGERVALVGKSGSGKSTFVKLLQRLYNLDSGRIQIDGQDIADMDPVSLRQAVSIVPQEPLLFHRSLGENIAYARPGASREEILQAARMARADDFIARLPDGLDTLVGERGVKLSGGERQRVAIARAFLADAPVLVLDEATSSLDVVTEAAVQDAIQDLMEGRTTVIIAHRLSTVRKMDRILVFEEGEVVEEGTYDALAVREGGYLARFHAVQASQDLTLIDQPA